MRIECIAIGTELLTTRRIDTNSVWLGERLAGLGLAFHRKTAVGDNREDLAGLFREALSRSDLILTTGGLGPTFDDFTKELFAEILGVELVEDAASREDLLAFYAARNRVPPQVNFKQTLIPVGAEPLKNPVGTAPGIWWQDPPDHPGVRVVMMPGVPREMKRMWEEQVEPRLRPLAGRAVHTLRMVVSGVPESALDEQTRAARERHAHLDWTILANLTQVELLARGAHPADLEAARRDFEAVLGDDLACVGEGNLEDAVLDQLREQGETLAVAESMTGGLLASRLTAIAGASQSFRGGVTAYTIPAKVAFLGLDADWLASVGTVSEACATAMAEAVRARLGATWALGICGNAGPGAEGGAPVGTVFIALAGPDGTAVRSPKLAGDRAEMQLRCVAQALDRLRRAVAVSR
ncbi:CinA family nicotinamide mononucleotide deamidase-related protein [Geothrix sp. PMB-07]|uniref:CinA family nicotinamide mononucleotide deamidase-related protein n=1 Tax=Geothrix sp. PMB-07 TaxID=3068640 RepID=UPI0027427227|nr:CinA family nicotinamide mononucleotide deamidase-related protein [Geothrix sp. PMB-07]WLT30011.1 CinA family nicotinamide mononucleotide deamidase-related protein [Geothrix sp. PMB-07]